MKKNKIIYFLIFATAGILLQAQQIKIEAAGSNTNAQLLQIEGEKAYPLDSAFIQNRVYYFSLKSRSTRFYR